MVKIMELFGGIGACTKAFENLNIPHEIVDYVEIDRKAVDSFNAIHNTSFEPQDISLWDKTIDVDLIMHGSPCQDFSVAGKGLGGDANSGTRSSLMYETIRIIEKTKPKIVIWENVKNILSKNHIHNFNNYIDRMKELGYVSYYEILDALDYGIPQRRERVFTVSIRNDVDLKFEFPLKKELKLKLADMLEAEVDKSYLLYNSNVNIPPDFEEQSLSKKLCKCLIEKKLVKEYDVICHSYARDRLNKCIEIEGRGSLVEAHNKLMTLPTKGYNYGVCVKGIGGGLLIRKITPKECWRFMGFDDEDYERASRVSSKTHLYKQAGNSIVVDVLEEIIKKLYIGEGDKE